MKPSERPPHDKKPSVENDDDQELTIEDLDRVAGGGQMIPPDGIHFKVDIKGE